VYKKTRALIDFQVSKKFANNKAEVKMTISDLLNQRQIFYQNGDSNTGYDAAKWLGQYCWENGIPIPK